MLIASAVCSDAPALTPKPLNTSSSSITVGWNVPNTHGGGVVRQYTLGRDDWWVDQPLMGIYNGTQTEFLANIHMLPATNYTFRVNANTAIGTSVSSHNVTYVTDGAGYCGNPADVAAFKATKTSMKKDIQSCLIGCKLKGGSKSCVVECINNDVGLSEGCAGCWYDEGQCTLNRCLKDCLNPSSDKCAKCSEDKCFPDCVVCSGVPKYFFPP
eukprot:m.121919 g.121919  ORF g.121919 m.121919 type:complete len:213 (+) comp17269_c0_seq54:49-687(+)